MAIDQCPLLKCKCIKTQYGLDRCSDNPTLNEATQCIGWLCDKVKDLEDEVMALDDVVNIKKGEHTQH